MISSFVHASMSRDTPCLVAHKRRKHELRAGLPPNRGRPGKATRYSLHAVRAAERDLAAQAEAAYRSMVAAWQPTGHGGTREPMVVTESLSARRQSNLEWRTPA